MWSLEWGTEVADATRACSGRLGLLVLRPVDDIPRIHPSLLRKVENVVEATASQVQNAAQSSGGHIKDLRKGLANRRECGFGELSLQPCLNVLRESHSCLYSCILARTVAPLHVVRWA